MESLINIGIILTYLMIIAGGVIILTKKYWPYFLAAYILVITINMVSFLLPYLVVITILFPIIESIILGSKNTKKMLYSLGGFLAIILLSYLMASDEVLRSYEKYEITASTVKKVGMGLTAFYLLAIGAIGAIFYAELSKVFSK